LPQIIPLESGLSDGEEDYTAAWERKPVGGKGNLLVALTKRDLPSWELTYPTLGKGKSSTQKCQLGGDMLVLWRVYIGWMIFPAIR